MPALFATERFSTSAAQPERNRIIDTVAKATRWLWQAICERTQKTMVFLKIWKWGCTSTMWQPPQNVTEYNYINKLPLNSHSVLSTEHLNKSNTTSQKLLWSHISVGWRISSTVLVHGTCTCTTVLSSLPVLTTPAGRDAYTAHYSNPCGTYCTDLCHHLVL